MKELIALKMALVDDIHKWKNKKLLIIGEALIDKYIIGTIG